MFIHLSLHVCVSVSMYRCVCHGPCVEVMEKPIGNCFLFSLCEFDAIRQTPSSAKQFHNSCVCAFVCIHTYPSLFKKTLEEDEVYNLSHKSQQNWCTMLNFFQQWNDSCNHN